MTKQEMLDAIYTEMGIYQWPDSAPAVEFEPVRIGDVLDWFDKHNPEHLWWWNWVINGEIITREWNNLRLPINDQSDDAISFVYNLIKK